MRKELNLEDIIKSKTFKEANEIFNKNKYLPGLYKESTFTNIDTLIKRECIDFGRYIFGDGPNFVEIDCHYDCGFVVPVCKSIVNNTFQCSQFEELVFLSVEIIPDECFLEANINKIFLPREIKKIGYDAFDYADIKEVYYEGTEDEFYEIDRNHDELNIKIIKFNSRIQDMHLKYVVPRDRVDEIEETVVK